MFFFILGIFFKNISLNLLQKLVKPFIFEEEEEEEEEEEVLRSSGV
ncbi:hypothetical protein GCW_01945 [Mycoplasmoides gallisepticum S6]|uniref:Uncharacterized protein n=1 Tax=Mycoplasmoides gallisepticum S6 TaxID=1006581 RepID=A0A0F6CLM9_MYCGL|nr:hypothetical protein GCW_01945 [Mycoplasmoides gallisepticum S6]